MAKARDAPLAMDRRKIDFADLPWKEAGDGLRYKEIKVGDHKMRLVEYGDGYRDDWCSRNHTGYVLEGRITVQFEDKEHVFTTGDGLIITGGKRTRHRASVAPGEKAVLVLFEPN